jgi:hypothetical protein
MGQQGDFGRNVLRGFGATQVGFCVAAAFSPHQEDGAHFPRRVLQHFQPPELRCPNNTLSSPLFGYSTQMLASSLAGAENAGFNPLYQIGGPAPSSPPSSSNSDEWEEPECH